jgi:hypothetical protein
VSLIEILLPDDVHGDDLGAAALCFEGEPSIPGADIEQTGSGKIFGKGKLRPSMLEVVEGQEALDNARRQFHAVIPASLGQLI